MVLGFEKERNNDQRNQLIEELRQKIQQLEKGDA
jgi:hypothetical protein